ncbi:MarR family transcriptional regulator [Parasedimentitalea maritima]|uniref:MarR family transcriptional regulator n=2 Tax=Parasedimentitalea TaxID=2738399 RepID=A0A6L6WEK2_9RHOB|nr:MarR family transcriptional regulator [Zongyanglinia marina]MVO16154.1 MarR family transcriptional regulator [Zongyanglinia huanghaiensis]TLP67394.1 MarR family transcriptional regulator [Zongyanglinia marina]
MLKATRAVENEVRENLRREFSSTLPRFDVMAALTQHNDGLKMSGLSTVLKVSNGNVTGIVERLVEDGLVIREKVPGDRRASLVKMTAKGRAEFAKQAAAHEQWIDTMFAGVAAEQVVPIADALDAVARQLDDKDER